MLNKKILMSVLAAMISVGSVFSADNLNVLEQDKKGNKICLIESLSGGEYENIDELIFGGIRACNEAILGENDFEEFTILVKNKIGETVAGAIGGISKKNQLQPSICAFQCFWIDEQYRDRSVDEVLVNGLVKYLKTKNCSLLGYPTAWDELSSYNGFLSQYGSLVSRSGSGLAQESDVIGFIIRRVQDTDIKNDIDEKDYDLLIEDRFNECFFEQIQEKTDEKLDGCFRAVSGFLNSEPYNIFVVSQEGKVIGGADGVIICYENDKKSCHLKGLWVDENHRGQGLGTSIIERFIEYAKNKQSNRITLVVFEWQAKTFFEKFGFVSTTDLFEQDDQSEGCINLVPHYMQKVL